MSQFQALDTQANQLRKFHKHNCKSVHTFANHYGCQKLQIQKLLSQDCEVLRKPNDQNLKSKTQQKSQCQLERALRPECSAAKELWLYLGPMRLGSWPHWSGIGSCPTWWSSQQPKGMLITAPLPWKLFLDAKASADTLLDLCMLHIQVNSKQQLYICYWSWYTNWVNWFQRRIRAQRVEGKIMEQEGSIYRPGCYKHRVLFNTPERK